MLKNGYVEIIKTQCIGFHHIGLYILNKILTKVRLTMCEFCLMWWDSTSRAQRGQFTPSHTRSFSRVWRHPRLSRSEGADWHPVWAKQGTLPDVLQRPGQAPD